MLTVECRACEGGCHMRQKLFDRKRLAQEPIRFDRDALCRQTAERVARHEEDAEFFLERQNLLNQFMTVDAGVLILGRA